jgi:di/tricarboxylate transporter
MIPLSFASILGGTCTLIGTSTNLVVLGMLNDWESASGETYSMGMFDLGLYGVPCALSGRD